MPTVLAASSTPAPVTAAATQIPTRAKGDRRRLAAALLLGQFVAMWTAFFILAPSIDWPASLDDPPAVILPLIQDQSVAVFLGYLCYLVHALLLVPIAALLPAALTMGEGSRLTSVLLGTLAGLTKALGISRWLLLMPALAIRLWRRA